MLDDCVLEESIGNIILKKIHNNPMNTKQKKIIVYGIGKIGKIYIDICVDTHLFDILYGIDRDEALREYRTIPIYRFSHLLEDDDKCNYLFMIAINDMNFYTEVYSSLIDMGVKEENIINVNFSKEWYKEIWKKLIVMKCDDPKIRVGRNGDGGYVMADNFRGNVAYSIGVGGDVSWDLSMAEKGYDVFMYDYTVSELPTENEKFHFFRQGLSPESDGNMMLSLKDMMEANGHESIDHLILKIDIEGAEWNVIDAIDEAMLKKVDQLVIEFHGINQFDWVIYRVLNKLDNVFIPIHVHANNVEYDYIDAQDKLPYHLEVSYINKKLVNEDYEIDKNIILPSSLDYRNVDSFPEIILGKWNERFGDHI